MAEIRQQRKGESVGNCYDNAVVESFFGTLKTECVTAQFATHALARTAIFEYIEVWYNRKRLHSTLGFLSPTDFEQHHGHFSCPLIQGKLTEFRLKKVLVSPPGGDGRGVKISAWLSKSILKTKSHFHKLCLRN